MEENRNSSPMNVCEKIYRAICCISHGSPADPAPMSASNPAVKTHDIHIIPISPQHPKPSEGAPETPKKREAAEVIPINLDYSSQLASKVGPEPPEEKAPPTQVNNEEGKKTGIHIEDRFTDYINRAKMKIRSMSKAGDGKHAPGVDHKGNEHFSDYIHRANIRLRNTSSIGRKNESN